MPSLPIAPAESPAVAIANGHVAQVRCLLQLGHHPNERLQDSRTPLILCAFLQEKQWACSVAQTLIEKGGDIGLPDNNGLNALHYACIYECEHLIKIYLNAIDFDLNQADKFGNTALHYAARSGNLKITSIMLEKLRSYSLSIDCPNQEGITPLMQAWLMANIETAEYLVEKGADTTKRDMSNRPMSYFEWHGRQKRRDHQKKDHDREMRKLLHFDDITSWTKYQNKLQCARQKICFKSWRDLENDRKSIPVVAKDDQAIIKVAGKADARNNATYVFKQSLTDMFKPRGTARAPQTPISSTRKASARPATTSFLSGKSAAETTDFTFDKMSSIKAQCTPGLIGEEEIQRSWKTQMSLIFDQYTFQCSPSFRHSYKHVFGGTAGASFESPVFGEKEGASPEGSEFGGGGQRQGINRRGSQTSIRGSTSQFPNRRNARRDRKVSNSPQRLLSTDAGHPDDQSAVTASSSIPPVSRNNKRGKVNRNLSRATFSINS